MQFMIYTSDKPDRLDIRQANREAHLGWLKTDKAVTLLTAGPWMDDAGTMRGSLLIVDADDKKTVMDWLSRDPYGQAGLPETVTVHPFKWVIGAPDS